MCIIHSWCGSNSQQSLAAVGIEADSDRVEALLKELEGKDITEVIASGVSKLASVPAGGGVAAAAGGTSLYQAACLYWKAAALHLIGPCRWYLQAADI